MVAGVGVPLLAKIPSELRVAPLVATTLLRRAGALHAVTPLLASTVTGTLPPPTAGTLMAPGAHALLLVKLLPEPKPVLPAVINPYVVVRRAVVPLLANHVLGAKLIETAWAPGARVPEIVQELVRITPVGQGPILLQQRRGAMEQLVHMQMVQRKRATEL